MFLKHQNGLHFLLSIAAYSLVILNSYGQNFTSQEINLNLIGSFGNYSVDGGTGLSFVDWNNDGFDDITLCTEEDENVLFYENKGSHFELLNIPLVENIHEGRQVLWVDYDNDSDLDLFLATYTQGIFLYENDGNMNFVDVTSDVGLPNNLYSTTGATFGDINLDGYLDLYLSNYEAANNLFEFDGFSYTDISLISGTSNGVQPSFCASFFDFNLDGKLDLYLANDKIQHPNSLYMNIGSSTFVDIGVASGTALNIDAMNAGVGDYNNDGLFDIYVTDEGVSSLLSNLGDSTFVDLAVSLNVGFDRLGWGANFLDFDNDEDQDLYVNTSWINGMYPSAFYINDNNVYSEPLYDQFGIANSDTLGSFANAIGDFNNDGLLDIVTSGHGNIQFRLFANHETNLNNFIKLKLIGVESNRDAIGALIEVYDSGTVRRFQKMCANAFLSQNSAIQHIGFKESSTFDSLKIIWPYDGSIDVFTQSDLNFNKLFVIEEGIGVVDQKELAICLDNHEIAIDPVPQQVYGASNILSCNQVLQSDIQVDLTSENEIHLDIGFEVPVGTVLEASITTCEN